MGDDDQDRPLEDEPLNDTDGDDPLPALPPLGDDADDELPSDESLGLDDEAGEENEELGLDDSAGFDDDAALFALELPPTEAIDDEDVDAIPIEGLDEDDEGGWTEGSEASDEPYETDDLDLDGLSPLASDDGGEEGVDESFEQGGGDDDASHLPLLRDEDADDEDADDLPIGRDAWIENTALLNADDEPPIVLPPRLDDPACRVEHLGPPGVPIFAFEPGPPALAGGSGGLWNVGEGCEPLGNGGLEAREVIAIALDPQDRARILVGTRLGGTLRSTDAGESFVESSSFRDSARLVAQSVGVAVEATAQGRVWAWAEHGTLFRSDDFGTSWAGPLLLAPVVAVATPIEGGVLALCAGRESAPQLARSDDGGQRWSAALVPAMAQGGEHFLAASGDHVAIACDVDPYGPHVSSDRGKTWARLPGVPSTGPIALVPEPGGVSLYAAHFLEAEDRGVVVRHRPGGGQAAIVLDVAFEVERRKLPVPGDVEGDTRVYALHAQRGERVTVLHAATGAGLFRVLLDPERLLA